jgi:RNA polymerase sigma-70 factor (ECF subfamily)
MQVATRAPASGDPGWDWVELRRHAHRQARRLLDSHEAEDAVQEAMIRAWRGRHRCRSPGSPKPWLRQIVRNEALRLRERRNGRADSVAYEEAEAGTSAGASEGPEDGLLRRMSLGQALAELGAQDRRLVVLRYVKDLRQGEIASILGIPEATVRVRLHRIRKRLGILIGEGT